MKFSRHAQSLQASYIREILSAASQPQMISMAGGLPATSLLPVALIREACESLADTPQLFQYGNSQGYQPLIETLQQHHAGSTQPWLICNGSQQGLDLIARALLQPGDQFVAEVPAYLGALQAFQLTGATLLPLLSNTAGPDLDQLEHYFKSADIKLFYAVPDFHNPTGRVWSADTRTAVATLCRHYGVTLIEDSPYRQLRFSGVQHCPVSELYPEQTIRLISFSKTGFPGLRVGAMNGPAEFMTIAERIKQATDLHTGIPQQMIIHQLLNHPAYPEHLQQLRQGYQRRYQQLSDELQQQLGQQIAFDPVEGGMFIWLSLKGKSGTRVAASALTHQLAVVPGAAFYDKDAVTEDCHIRLNFSNTDATLVKAAVSRLATALRAD